MSDKVFRTHDELLALLRDRGIDLSTAEKRSFAKKALQHEGYYNLINGYNKLFLSSKVPEDTYKQGTTIEEIMALYSFDRKLRNIFLKHILVVETNVKSLLAYNFPQKYGHDNYMLYKNFDTSRKGAGKNITKVIASFQRQIAEHAADPSIAHYLGKYGYVPLWVVNNIVTLGQTSQFYRIMKQQDRQSVAKVFSILDNDLESILFYLAQIRNCCAHGNRLYCFRSSFPLSDMGAHAKLSIPLGQNGELANGKRDLFATMIALYYVLPNAQFRRLIKELQNALNNLRTKLNVISEEDVLKEMGFPLDWKNQLLSL